jgi:hypothetical protein
VLGEGRGGAVQELARLVGAGPGRGLALGRGEGGQGQGGADLGDAPVVALELLDRGGAEGGGAPRGRAQAGEEVCAGVMCGHG